MATLSTLGWSLSDGKWYHEDTGRYVEIRKDVIEVYKLSGHQKVGSWLTEYEFERFYTVIKLM